MTTNRCKPLEGRYEFLKPVKVHELLQLIFTDEEIIDNLGFDYICAAELVIHPSDRRGDPVEIYDEHGNVVTGWVGSSPYYTAAEYYEAPKLEAQPVTKPVVTFGPV